MIVTYFRRRNLRIAILRYKRESGEILYAQGVVVIPIYIFFLIRSLVTSELHK